ncbi:UNVERIFIED_CONTAM: hypothetical protein Sradi_2110700 [Sesamum radiatum]|uniref:Uncharacterized protein n=1 Tax=Sesamum radiatum TaxID=300843 RepID=A0AAW2TJ48_SESRA
MKKVGGGRRAAADGRGDATGPRGCDRARRGRRDWEVAAVTGRRGQSRGWSGRGLGGAAETRAVARDSLIFT